MFAYFNFLKKINLKLKLKKNSQELSGKLISTMQQ